MAISPKDAARDLDTKITKAVGDIEKEIDEQLSKQWFTGCGGIYIYVDAEQFKLPTVPRIISEKYAPEWTLTPLDVNDAGRYRIFVMLSKDIPKQS